MQGQHPQGDQPLSPVPQAAWGTARPSPAACCSRLRAAADEAPAAGPKAPPGLIIPNIQFIGPEGDDRAPLEPAQGLSHCHAGPGEQQAPGGRAAAPRRGRATRGRESSVPVPIPVPTPSVGQPGAPGWVQRVLSPGAKLGRALRGLGERGPRAHGFGVAGLPGLSAASARSAAPAHPV